jgi:hypothetical protein
MPLPPLGATRCWLSEDSHIRRSLRAAPITRRRVDVTILMVGKATLWAVLIELLVFHHQQFFKPVVPLSLMTTASAPYYPRPGCGPRRGVAGPAFVLIRGAFARHFFTLMFQNFLPKPLRPIF